MVVLQGTSSPATFLDEARRQPTVLRGVSGGAAMVMAQCFYGTTTLLPKFWRGAFMGGRHCSLWAGGAASIGELTLLPWAAGAASMGGRRCSTLGRLYCHGRPELQAFPAVLQRAALGAAKGCDRSCEGPPHELQGVSPGGAKGGRRSCKGR